MKILYRDQKMRTIWSDLSNWVVLTFYKRSQAMIFRSKERTFLLHMHFMILSRHVNVQKVAAVSMFSGSFSISLLLLLLIPLKCAVTSMEPKNVVWLIKSGDSWTSFYIFDNLNRFLLWLCSTHTYKNELKRKVLKSRWSWHWKLCWNR